MECKIYDTELNLVAVIQSWISLDWLEEYNGVGAFTLELNAQAESYSNIQLDYYCGIAESDTLMIIKSIIARKNRIIFNGFAAIYLLNDRISRSTIDGTSVKAETLMRNIVNTIVSGTNLYPCVSIETNPAGISTYYRSTLDKGSMLDRVISIAVDADIGVRMRHDKENRRLLFSCFKPTSVSARYYSEYGSISDPEYMRGNSDLKNYIWVEGQDGRYIGFSIGNETGAARKELYVDATGEERGEMTDTEYNNLLRAKGLEELAKHSAEQMLNFQITDTSAELGAIAECKITEFGITATVRIIGIEILSQNNRIERRVTLGTPKIIRR